MGVEKERNYGKEEKSLGVRTQKDQK